MKKQSMTSTNSNHLKKKDFLAFFKHSNYLALMMDAQGNILELNQRLLEAFNLKTTDLLHKNFFNVLQAKNIPLPFQSIEEGFASDNHLTTISKSKNKKAVEKSYQWSISRIDETTPDALYLISGFEVTGFINSRHREQLIKASIIDHIPNHYIFWKDTNSVYLGCNTAMAHAMELSSCNDIIGKTDYDLPTTREQSTAYRIDDKEVMESKTAKLNIEEYQTLADGKKRVLMTSKTPLFDENNEVCGILAIYSDITDRKNMEQDLENARDQAEAANRAKSEFIANMSHDIRTPLTGIIGLSSILKDEITDPELKEHAHMLNISGEQLLSLLNSVLDIVASDSMREKQLNDSTFNLHEMLHNLVKLELPALQLKSTELHLQLDDNLPCWVVSDKGKIYRILLNLLSNAIKFTLEGHITLGARLLEQNEETLLLEFQIKDTGIGIAKNDKDKIFDEFFRATPSYEGKFDGYGVGLHIVQQYLTHLKGSIEVDSDEGQGTCVTFTLPLRKGNEPVSAHYPKHTSQTHSSSPPIIQSNVLLVEDNSMAMKVATRLLEKSFCAVTQAYNSNDALDVATSNRFDFILTDIGLPDFSGFELAERIHQYEKNQGLPLTPIIGLTAHARQKTMPQANRSGMVDICEKPLKRDSILNYQQQYTMHTPSVSPLSLTSKDHKDPLHLIPLFEPEQAANQLGSTEILKSIVSDFISEDFNECLKNMHTHVQQKNWAQFRKLLHQFKSSCLYCSVSRLLYISKLMEQASDSDIGVLYKDFQTTAELTKNRLTEWIEHPCNPT